MLIKSYGNGTPFIGSLFKIDRSIFLNQTKQSFIYSTINSTSTDKNTISGHAGNFDIKKVIKSSMGEWIERNSLFCDKYPNQKFIPAVNIINGKTIEVEKERILFKEKFNDSCGVASHLDSESVIRSSYYEFFERQSLIYNWITESEGTIIDYSDNINHPIIKQLINSAYKYIDELYLIDISLHKSLKVVLALGFGEYHKSIGISSSFNGVEAIVGALEEMFQIFTPRWSKGYINNQVDANAYKSDGKEHNSYLKDFMNLTPVELKHLYNYLIKSERLIKMEDYIDGENEFSIDNIQIISDDLGLEPYCAFIPSFYHRLHTKIIKIFSPDGYPHMHPPFFSEKETLINFNKLNDNFSNAYKEVPFP